MSFVFDPAPISSVAIQGSTDRFPIRRIFCVGRNYAEHAREMGHDPNREPPFFFTKPADAIVEDGVTLPYPLATTNLHHEAELVVAIGTGGTNISEDMALDHVFGYAAGNDLTRRDLQSQAKEMRRPWDWAKAFDNSAPVGAIFPVADAGHPVSAEIICTVNGDIRQEANISDMLWSVPEIIAHLSAAVALAPGDLIMTGTPSGVGEVKRGETVSVSIAGLGSVTTGFDV